MAGKAYFMPHRVVSSWCTRPDGWDDCCHRIRWGRMSTTSVVFSRATGRDVRVRFCPSPTGTPHVGLIRTALFNWAVARHHGGAFVFRIEDTDAARDSEQSYAQLVDALSWLGLGCGEGWGGGSWWSA